MPGQTINMLDNDNDNNKAVNTEIICVEHCEKKIFALGFPEECPDCQSNLKECELTFPPFSLPMPFARAQDHPCSIVIKPTKGDFLLDYQNRNNLHIGITDSKGSVVEYDVEGIHTDRSQEWGRCVVLDGLSSAFGKDVVEDADWPEYWDICLEGTLGAAKTSWTVEAYDEAEHNCFAFVLAFLRSLKQNPVSHHAKNKLDFCSKYVLPKTTNAGKYICLYRKIKDHNGAYATVKQKRKE